jgi:hypothetical protein
VIPELATLAAFCDALIRAPDAFTQRPPEFLHPLPTCPPQRYAGIPQPNLGFPLIPRDAWLFPTPKGGNIFESSGDDKRRWNFVVPCICIGKRGPGIPGVQFHLAADRKSGNTGAPSKV